jgi:hypothetical protein
MQDVPIAYVKANQVGVIAVIILASLLKMPFLLILLWVVLITGAIFGSNLFMQVVKPFVKVQGAETQAKELFRFNTTLALLFLTLSLLCIANGWTAAGNIFAWLLGVVILVALSGYCIGCTIYYQFKQFKARRKSNK